MSKTKQHNLEKKIDLAACDLLDACREYHDITSGKAPLSYVEVFGLAVLALEGINYQLVTKEQRKRLIKRAKVANNGRL